MADLRFHEGQYVSVVDDLGAGNVRRQARIKAVSPSGLLRLADERSYRWRPDGSPRNVHGPRGLLRLVPRWPGISYHYRQAPDERGAPPRCDGAMHVVWSEGGSIIGWKCSRCAVTATPDGQTEHGP